MGFSYLMFTRSEPNVFIYFKALEKRLTGTFFYTLSMVCSSKHLPVKLKTKMGSYLFISMVV